MRPASARMLNIPVVVRVVHETYPGPVISYENTTWMVSIRRQSSREEEEALRTSGVRSTYTVRFAADPGVKHDDLIVVRGTIVNAGTPSENVIGEMTLACIGPADNVSFQNSDYVVTCVIKE